MGRAVWALAAAVLWIGWVDGQHRAAAAWADGSSRMAPRLAEGVAAWVHDGVEARPMGAGAARFEDEWRFGTYMMAAAGFGQRARRTGDPRDVARMGEAVDRMLAARAFDADGWGEDPLAALVHDRGHVAWLGYAGVALGLERPWSDRHAAVHDAVADALARRLVAHDGLVETYPGERYPVDIAAAVGALALHQRATGGEHGSAIAAGRSAIRRSRDPATGLLVQAVDAEGLPLDVPRGSGTFLAAWFLSFDGSDLARDLYAAGREHLYVGGLGFGAMREFPNGVRGRPDVDSGPVVMGLGMSSTGFALAGALRFGDAGAFAALYATAATVGVPLDTQGGLHFATGGPIGDAILFAMLTATPLDDGA